MITTTNYYATLKTIDRSALHPDLKAVADLVDEITNNGNNWLLYRKDDEIRETVDIYFEKLSEYLAENGNGRADRGSEKTTKPKQSITVVPAKASAKQRTARPNVKPRSGKTAMRVVARPGKPVKRISEEVRFIKKFVYLNGRVKTRKQIQSFLRTLQRAMIGMPDNTEFSGAILEIQDALIELLEHMDKLQPKKKQPDPDQSIEIEIGASRLARFQQLCGMQELMHSVRFIRSYISLQGKLINNNQAKSLHNRIAKTINAEAITTKDPYYGEITDILNTLESFVKKNPTEGVLVIPTRQLNGLEGIVSGLNGIEDVNDGYDVPPRNVIMNSLDFVQMNFKTIGFKDKWLNFIGDPSPGFLALVAAPAKFGKSILCVDWAAYLARNHGRVLYIAREEGLDLTLKEKLAQAAHENLTVSDFIPDDLSPYEFIFFDSITMLQIRPSDIEQIKAEYPNKGLIFISQVNKAGTARGSNEFYHNVDIIIQFPEIGRAVQYGRFNQGGEMFLFK